MQTEKQTFFRSYGQAIIENVDRETGIITTDWLQDDSAFRQIMIGGQRTRLNVNVDSVSAENTRVDVRLYWQSQKNFGNWQANAISKGVAEENIGSFFESVENRLNQQ